MALLSRSVSQSKVPTLPCFARRRKNSKDSDNSENMRIIDVLRDRDGDDEGGEIEEKKGFLDSRVSISRFFSKNSFRILRKRRSKKGAGSGSELHSDPGASSDETRGSAVSDSGRKHEDIAFNLGMGMSLFFLLAKSVSEFNKVVELRQMEMLLKEVRQEVHGKDTKDGSSESDSNISNSHPYCPCDINTCISTSMPNCNGFFAKEEDRYGVESDSESKYATAFANTRNRSIVQMEAELEVELERLQDSLKGESSSLPHHRIEVDRESSDPSFDGFSVNYEEDDAPNCTNQESNGVCAYELERKLHELLETRQRHQIAELESALKLTEKKLREKEMELDWWKETQWAAAFSQEESFISRELEGLTSV